MKRFVGIGLLVGACMFSSSLALAQPEQQTQRGPWVWSLGGGAAHQFESDLDNQGDFSSTRWFAQGSVGYGWDRDTSVSLSLDGGETHYDFSDDTSIGGGKPWETIRNFRVSVPVRFSPAEDMSAIIIPSVRFNTESGASLDDGRTEGALAGVSWRLSQTFAIGPGIGWFSELGGGSQVFPIVLIDWDITDRLKLSTGPGPGASQGPGLTLSWKATDTIGFSLSGRWERTRFALDDSGPSPNGIGEERSFPFAVSIDYRATPAIELNAFVGAEFGGRLRLEDRNGNGIQEVDYDPAPIAGAAFRLRF